MTEDIASLEPNAPPEPEVAQDHSGSPVRSAGGEGVFLAPRSTHPVRQAAYQGPLDRLLELVRERQIEIFKISLADIADDFLVYVRGLERHNLDEAGDFLVIASQLLAYKSRNLLPTETEEEEEEPVDEQTLLLQRLKDYERFREAAGHLRKAEEDRRMLYLREKPPPTVEQKDVVEFYEVNIFDLAEAFKRVLAEIGETGPALIQGEEFTIDEKMAELQLLLHDTGELCLTLYLQSMRTRVEVIVTFLALLELIRLLKVRAKQSAHFGDIWLHRTDPLSRDSAGEVELVFRPEANGFVGEKPSSVEVPFDEPESEGLNPDQAPHEPSGV